MPRWPAAWGGPGAVALLALIAAAPLALVLAPHWQAEADALRQAQAPRRARPVVVTPSVAPPPRQLPPGGEESERVAALLRLAQRQGVDVQRTQQQLDRSGPLPRLQLGLSAQGRYADLRAFVAGALQADPGLALDRLQWRRATAEAERLDAELQWSMLQGPRAGTASP